ncbi:MAG: hypothetical protein GXY83_01775 [Rhodopirellula sp.]|nr:hypothetical protein [Rhodopirellula sp.]
MATARLFRPSGTERNLQGVALIALLTAGLAFGAVVSAQGQHLLARRSDPLKASSSREAREDAIRSIPLDKLTGDAQATVKSVLSNVSIYRRMPVQAIQCDPEMYLFLVRHPDVVVNIWQVLGITQVSLTQVDADCYRLTDSAGTEGTVRLLYQSQDTHLIYTEGKYEGPFSTKPTHGRVVLLLKTGYVRQSDGQCLITVRLDTFMQVEPGGVEVFTKTFQPIMGKIADINFAQTIGFVGSLSRTAEVNCRGVQRLASKLSSVQPAVRDHFADLAQRVAEKAAAVEPQDGNRDVPLIAGSVEESSIR